VQRRIQLDQGYLDEMWMTWEDSGPVIEEGTVEDNYLLTTKSGRKFFRLSDNLEYDDSLAQDEISTEGWKAR
jgi:hypothetical protein